jgi:hypothetical protein
MAEQVRQVVRQTKARIFDGLTKLPGKLFAGIEGVKQIV